MKALDRRLGLTGVIAISIGAMLGSGIFVLPGLAAQKTGPSVWMAYVLAGICVLPAAFSKAELATAMPTSGGTYIYLDRAFGPLAGTVSGLGLWLSLLLKSSFALVGFGAYLAVFSDFPLIPTALILLSLITVLNLLGVGKVSSAQVIIVAISLTGLLTLVISGLFSFDSANLQPTFTHGSGGFVAAMAFVYVSFAGVTKIAAVAEEVKDPGRNIPRGMLLSLVLVTAVYGAVVFVMVATISVDGLRGDLSPVYTLGRTVGGPVLGVIAAVLGILTLTSMANAGILAASRFPFAMSRDGLLPPTLKTVHRRFMTPVNCILLTAGLMVGAIVFIDIDRIVKLASAFIIMAYVAENAVVVVFRESGAGWYKPDYRSPLYPWIQIFGIAVGLLLLVMLGWVTMAALVVLGLPGGAIYAFYGRSRTSHRGVLANLGPRRDVVAARNATDVDDENEEQAGAMVAFFGRKRYPETLIELGAALTEGRGLKALHVTHIPEQTFLGAMVDEDDGIAALRRRISLFEQDKDLEVGFDCVVTRDVGKAVHDAVIRLGCDWLVMEWRGRVSPQLTLFNPLGWLMHHLPCNLALFWDGRIRYIRKILVFAEPGPHDALVTRTADHLASVFGADLTFARFVPKSSPEKLVESEAEYSLQMSNLCKAPTETLIIKGKNIVNSIVGATKGFDLLILGGGPETGMFRTNIGTVNDKLTSLATCSVLQLRTPREQTHHAFDERVVTAGTDGLKLIDLVEPGCVQARLRQRSKEALFNKIAVSFGESLDTSSSEIEAALWERERAQNTAIVGGVAMPHAVLQKADRSSLGIMVAAEPLDYQAPDGTRVDVFFVIVGPLAERQTHLKLLSSLAKLSLDTPFLEKLRQANSSDEIITLTRRFCHAFDGNIVQPGRSP